MTKRNQSYSVHEEWKENLELPEEWMYKKNRKNIRLSRKGTGTKVNKKAIMYIRRRLSKNYSQTNLKAFISSESNKPRSINQAWNRDPAGPDGWKIKTSGKSSFLSPEGSKFQSRKNANPYMITQN